MNGENELEQKNLKKKIIKKHSLQEKTQIHKLNKNFPILHNSNVTKAYSTKLVSNFVPVLKPKKSFCKPAFMQLSQVQPKFEIEKEDSDLDVISSSEGIDESESDSNQSSSMTSSNDEIDKEEEKSPEYDIQKKDISDSEFSNQNVNKEEDKIVKEILEHKLYNEDKNDLNLTNKENNNNNNNINDEAIDENKVKNNLTQNIIISNKKSLSILDILKNKNKVMQ